METPEPHSPIARWVAVGLVVAKGLSVAFEWGNGPPAMVPTLAVAAVALVLWQMRPAAPSGSSRNLIRRWTNRAMICTGLFMALFIALTVVAERGLRGRAAVGSPVGRTLDVSTERATIWSSRGLVVEGPAINGQSSQNTVRSLELAFESGAPGVEVDVFYDPPIGDFIVSHDRPYKKVNGEWLRLGEVLEVVGNGRALWLDWKKLRHLSATELQAAIQKLDEITKATGTLRRMVVEGEDPLHLAKIRDAGFLTLYDCHPLPEANPLSSVLVDFYKLVYYFGGHTYFSLESGSSDNPVFGSRTAAQLRHVPVFVYHVPNEDELLRRLLSEPNVSAVLPEDHSVDRFGRPADLVQQP